MFLADQTAPGLTEPCQQNRRVFRRLPSRPPRPPRRRRHPLPRLPRLILSLLNRCEFFSSPLGISRFPGGFWSSSLSLSLSGMSCLLSLFVICPFFSFIPSYHTSSSVQRSTSIPSNLPWASLCRSGSLYPQSTIGLLSSPSATTHHNFLSSNRVSAFRPLVKNTTPTNSTAELPRGHQPQHLSPQKMRSCLVFRVLCFACVFLLAVSGIR